MELEYRSAFLIYCFLFDSFLPRDAMLAVLWRRVCQSVTTDKPVFYHNG